jgi:hypothetical protein
VKLRPKWSLVSGGTPASRSRFCLLLAAVLLGACSDLDPNIGPLRSEPNGLVDGGAPGVDAGNGDVDPEELSFFKDKVRPLMNRPSKGDPTGKGCKGCHYSTEANHTGLDLSALDLATLGALRRGGGSSGSRIVVPGKPAESILIRVLKGQYGYANQMPKNGPFWSADEVKLVETWISQGAKGADGE